MIRKQAEYICLCFHFFFIVFIGPFFCIPLLIFLLYLGSYFRYFGLVYIAYTWWTWNKKDEGGVSSNWFRSCKYCHLCCSYFPIILHKPKEPFGNKNHIIGVHPHGLFAASTYAYAYKNSKEYIEIFGKDDVNVVSVPAIMQIPFIRDYILALGIINASERSLMHVLSKPKRSFVALVVGGPKEVFHYNEHCIILKNKKGFCRVALKTGASLVPSYVFGEINLYDFVKYPSNSWIRRVQNYLVKVLHIAVPIVKGSWKYQYMFVMPKRKPIHIVYGKPIDVERVENPKQEEIDALHGKYIDELTRVFYENKAKYCLDSDVKLTIK